MIGSKHHSRSIQQFIPLHLVQNNWSPMLTHINDWPWNSGKQLIQRKGLVRSLKNGTSFLILNTEGKLSEAQLSVDEMSGGCRHKVFSTAIGSVKELNHVLTSPWVLMGYIHLNLTSLSVENFADSLKCFNDDMAWNLSMAELMVM